jgi:hypothetical protein
MRQRVGVDQRAAPRERQREGVARQHDEAGEREQRVVLGQRRLAQEIVDQPAQRQRDDAAQRHLPRRERYHRGIDQEEARVAVIDPAQQRKAGYPGPIGLPLVPDQMVGQDFGRERIFVHLVKAAGVHLPGHAGDARLHVLHFAQRSVQVHEEERRADPGDRRRDVQPAQQNRSPFPDIRTPGAIPLSAFPRARIRPCPATLATVSLFAHGEFRRWLAAQRDSGARAPTRARGCSTNQAGVELRFLRAANRPCSLRPATGRLERRSHDDRGAQASG